LYTPGRIIFFDPFHFKGGGSKAKYFLVLKVVENKTILASLPSSQVHLPASQETVHGCLEKPESGINCYIFQANKPITTNGWSFPQNTFLYGMWLDDYEITHLEANYNIPGVDFEIIGELVVEELAAVIDCFKNSATVKRKYKRWLGA
jgi:hypothetical protein